MKTLPVIIGIILVVVGLLDYLSGIIPETIFGYLSMIPIFGIKRIFVSIIGLLFLYFGFKSE